MGDLDLKQVEALVERATAAEPVRLARSDDDFGDVLVVPAGRQVVDVRQYLDPYLDEPRRIRGTSRHQRLESFLAHVARFKDDGTAIFVDVAHKPPTACAVYNYNPGPGKPRHGDHRSVYGFQLSEEWAVWTGIRGPLGQGAFAELIEERILDVIEPDAAGEGAKTFAAKTGTTYASPSALLDLSRGLSIRVEASVTQVVKLQSGESQFSYGEAHKTDKRADLTIPGAFLLALRVFDGGDYYQVPARLRYRHKEGQISWSIDLYRADRVFDDAVESVLKEIREKTGRPVFIGTPDAER
jgi:uncharacterized protein YfdQ (DUF2303 family)